MEDNMFRDLTWAEIVDFKQWARESYSPGEPISELWHPVVRDECNKMNAERTQA